MSSYQGGQTSSKPRTIVKPMLRKLAQGEKTSLDLDSPAAEQDGLGIYDYGPGSRSSHDVVFNHTTRRGYHNRSTSGTSQFSTGTTGSGHRTGSFVHPFQQTPRPYTPPLGTPSYQNSVRESEPSNNNSPALTEDDDQLRHNFRSPSNLSNHTPSVGGNSPISAQPMRLIPKTPSNTRLALASSHSSLHKRLSTDLPSPVELMSPSSTIHATDKGAFRIRSRSEVNPGVRIESIQEARRKFEEKEQAKEEKVAREEIKALEKRNQKEAREIEKRHRRSSASDGTRSKRSKSDLTMPEKGGDEFLSRDYNSVNVAEAAPYTSDGFDSPGRNHSISKTKKKTHGAWTKLMMWLRTRFIRMGSKTRERQNKK